MGTALANTLLALVWWQWAGIIVIIALVVLLKVYRSRQQ